MPLKSACVVHIGDARLSQQASLDDYERVPIEAFGAALLRGMGWKEGEALGSGKFKGYVSEHFICNPRANVGHWEIAANGMVCVMYQVFPPGCVTVSMVTRLAEPMEYVPKFGRGGLGAGPTKDIVCCLRPRPAAFSLFLKPMLGYAGHYPFLARRARATLCAGTPQGQEVH